MAVDIAIWSLFGVTALLGLYPFGPFQATLWLVRRVRGVLPAPRPGFTQEPGGRVAVLLCAYNEEAVLRDKIANTLALDPGDGSVELLLYVDGATDGTLAIAQDCADRYGDRVTLVASAERRGKAYGVRQLLARCTAPIVVFTDANVAIAPDAVTRLRRYFADPEIGCVCGHLSYVNGEESATAGVGALYWRLDEWTKQLETDTGSAMGADGSLYAARRDCLPNEAEDLFDDLFVSMSILAQGKRVVRAPDVRACEIHVSDPAEEFQRKIRISSQSFTIHRRLWPRLRRLDAWTLYQYLGHRYLRWVGGYSLALAGVLFEIGLVRALGPVGGTAAALLPAVLLGLGWVLRVRLATGVVNIALALLATSIGVYMSLAGRRAVTTWKPAQSVRSRFPTVSG
ncbi:glycosyltransferase [Azospirillum sp.]|uniref:glycosyltransferase n=1 Tax=Azospirillum sp. TaxID=34012 RepID=UPI002D2FDC2F|nr:glycosyltransferase [Azospirillum sp.]HYD67082.1 glycosyltransferase [Azospirillum sp.]